MIQWVTMKNQLIPWLTHGLTIIIYLLLLIPWFDHKLVNLCGYRMVYPWLSIMATLLLSYNCSMFLKHRYPFQKVWLFPWLNFILFLLPSDYLISDTIHTTGLFIISGWIILLSIYPNLRQLKILAIAAAAALASMGLTLNINYLSELIFIFYMEYIMVEPLFKSTFHR